ncbi:MscL family protein [candidate division WWE3 bacterium]|uniref:MscL family protein n=1 Tax=candidate division WWE3 bacterium TaxID=2053526 RepID=A0A7X9HSQ5_UNCKA|nr:MscL family protein [candidate division WWE3 bacterium]
MKDFIKFIREQGVVGLAVGFILGGAVSEIVSSIIKDLINPLLGLVLGLTGGLQTSVLKIGSAELGIGNFISTLIDFLIISLVVYFGVKLLKLEKLDKKKD